MNYRAVGHRCAVHLPSLDLPLTPKQIQTTLEKLNFFVLELNMVSLARSFIGISHYRLGATLNEAPDYFDCSSFTKYLYAHKGIWIPRLSIQQREKGVIVNCAARDDLVFTTGYRNFYDTDPHNNVGHVGIATDEGTIIHAADKYSGVIETTYTDFVQGNPRGFRRVVVPGTITLQCPDNLLVETSDDLRWLILKNI